MPVATMAMLRANLLLASFFILLINIRVSKHNERVVRDNVIFAIELNVIDNLALVPIYEAIFKVISTSFSLTLQNILVSLTVLKFLNIKMFYL